MRNTLETDRQFLERLTRAATFVPLGQADAASATVQDFVLSAAGYDGYPQQLTRVSWCYVDHATGAPVDGKITIEVYHGATKIGEDEIPAAAANMAMGDALKGVPIEDLDLSAKPLLVTVKGDAGNAAGSNVSITLQLTPA